ncbi:unnamed protein product [Enterobius vermicularis]|uniref:Reverse transcriptase domain-containing protein n=1 Tax=Enterobius vermicularis TaxID=51028 RepID=A0A0N4VQ97_ENTVE|nr:unnamed protein product [Enterobius vermicularis]
MSMAINEIINKEFEELRQRLEKIGQLVQPVETEDKVLLIKQNKEYINKERIQIKLLRNNLSQIESLHEKWLNLSASESVDEEQMGEAIEDLLGDLEQLRKARKTMTIIEANVEQCKENLQELTKQEKTVPISPNVFTLPIPTFNGNLTEWFSFWNSFETYVEKNNKLGKIQELSQLKKVLAGEAKKLVEGYIIFAADYEIVKRNLEKRPCYSCSQKHDVLFYKTWKEQKQPVSSSFLSYINGCSKTEDYLSDQIDTSEDSKSVLSNTSQFDSLGSISSTTSLLRKFCQKLWERHYKWDELLGSSLMQEWNRLVKPFKFAQFAHRQVPSDGNWDLHVFIDGSKNGYAAIVYATVKVENTKYSSIMYAKSRLMPIKLITMPKAELLAAETIKDLGLKFRFVPSEDNPADIGSMECIPNKLKNNDLRWSDPD